MPSERHWTRKAYLAALLLVLTGTISACQFGSPATARGTFNAAPLRNFGVVWEHKLTRSGMPQHRGDAAWQWLRNQGVRSVVSFRMENDVDYHRFGFERVLRLPMGGDPPSQEQAERFLRFVSDPTNQPVHIHCTAGRDRTGMMTALARYAIDGWPMDKALAEARLYRDGRDLSEKRVTWLRDWAAHHPAGSYKAGP